MISSAEWSDFVRHHGEIVGYTTDSGGGVHPRFPPWAEDDLADPLVRVARELGIPVYAVYGVRS
ncbi:hypothetical protein [Amycolatopsis anabasis]|uniref:hypothetical protein n=1 Tax=Amycolatopsis anabasis TaxID=1840409 RepID=UPI00131E9848|nr:hypothetical protein [Amycolatopsis anabasis]